MAYSDQIRVGSVLIYLFLTQYPLHVVILINFMLITVVPMLEEIFSPVVLVKVWNSLPTDRVDFGSLGRFRRSLHNIDFSSFLTVE